jgi:hypothetical protein
MSLAIRRQLRSQQLRKHILDSFVVRVPGRLQNLEEAVSIPGLGLHPASNQLLTGLSRYAQRSFLSGDLAVLSPLYYTLAKFFANLFRGGREELVNKDEGTSDSHR